MGRPAWSATTEHLTLEQGEDRAWRLAQRLVVALALGDDEVSLGKAAPEPGAAVLEERARRVGAVVDDLDQIGEARRARVLHGRVVEDGLAAHRDRDPLDGQPLDQQAVEGDLTAVVGVREDPLSPLDIQAQVLDQAKYGFIKGLVDRGPKCVAGHCAVDAEIDDIARDGQLDRQTEGVIRRVETLAQVREQAQHLPVLAVLLGPVGVPDAAGLANPPMDPLPDQHRRLDGVAVGKPAQGVADDPLMECWVIGDSPAGVERLAHDAGNAIEGGLHRWWATVHESPGPGTVGAAWPRLDPDEVASVRHISTVRSPVADKGVSHRWPWLRTRRRMG